MVLADGDADANHLTLPTYQSHNAAGEMGVSTMEWLIGIVAVVVIGWAIAHFNGKPGFWALTRKHPAAAMLMFRSDPAWKVFDHKPAGGYASELPGDPKEWTGPFKVLDPARNNLVTVYGKFTEIDASEDRFVQRFSGKK